MGLIRPLVMVAVVIPLLVMPLACVSAVECEDCHSSSGGSGGYEFDPPIVVLSKPLICGPEEKVKVRLYVLPTSVYSVEDIEAMMVEMDVSGTVTGRATLDPDGQDCLEWELGSGTDPLRSMIVTCSCICYYEHGSPGNKDDGAFNIEVRFDLNIVSSSLRIDRDFVLLPEEGSSLSLRAIGSVSNLKVATSPTLEGKVSATLDRTDLQDGGSAMLSMTSLSMGSMDGHLNLSWTESGMDRHAYIRVLRVRPKTADGTDLYHEIGKYTGISAFVLLVIGYLTGGTGPFRRWGNKLFRTAARRTRFHCALSFEVLVLVMFHMLVLWYGPYRELIWIWEVVLGELALVVMAVIALNGMFQRRLVSFIGYQNWRRVHAWGTYISTGLVVVHMLTNGTHFLWFRQMMGMA